MQPDAVPATEIVAIVRGIMEMKAVPIYRGGAADAQRVRWLPPLICRTAPKEFTDFTFQCKIAQMKSDNSRSNLDFYAGDSLMNVMRITTENAELEQWRLLSQFTYTANILKFLQSRGATSVEEDTVELIAGSIRQGEAYFKAAADAPLDISPLLQYYGAANLLTGAHALLTNVRPPIANHGMTIPRNHANRIADVQVLPRSPTDGALQIFCNLFSRGCNITNGSVWTLGEIIGSIPDLTIDFRNHYQDLTYYSLPVEIVFTQDKSVERIAFSDLGMHPNLDELLNLIPDFKKAYLAPQKKSTHLILNTKIKGASIGTFSISGRKYLQISHLKNSQLLCPDQIILMHMGLFALGFLPRYRPELWNPFVRSDKTGEKRIIEKFVSICQRYLPHLVLNFIYGERLHFVNASEGTVELNKSFTEAELKRMIQDTIQDMHSRGEI
jgi:hypothetical protein